MPYFDGVTSRLTPMEEFSIAVANSKRSIKDVSVEVLYETLFDTELGTVVRTAAAELLKDAGEPILFRSCSVSRYSVEMTTYEYTNSDTGEVKDIEIGGN